MKSFLKSIQYNKAWELFLASALSLVFQILFDQIINLPQNLRWVYVFSFIITIAILLAAFQFLARKYIYYSDKIEEWQNKERKADFYISNLSQSLFSERLFLFSLSFPKTSKAFLYIDVTCKITPVRKKVDSKTVEIDTHFGKMTFDSSFMQGVMDSIPLKETSPEWQGNKNRKIRITRFGSQLAYGFVLDDWGDTFSLYYPNKNTSMKSVGNYFEIGEHEFKIDIEARDFYKRRYEQHLLYSVEYDGQMIKTVSIKVVD